MTYINLRLELNNLSYLQTSSKKKNAKKVKNVEYTIYVESNDVSVYA